MTAKKQTEQSFAARLQQLMDEHNPPWGIQELADAVQVSYEHTRKMVRGLSVPSKFVIRALAEIFKIDASELEAVAKTDQFHRKYGEDSPTPIFNPEVAPFATAWTMLTEAQKTFLLTHLKTFVSKNAKAVTKGL